MKDFLMKRVQNINALIEEMGLVLVGMSGAACAHARKGFNASGDYMVLSQLEQIKYGIRQELREIAINELGAEEVIERLCSAIEEERDNLQTDKKCLYKE